MRFETFQPVLLLHSDVFHRRYARAILLEEITVKRVLATFLPLLPVSLTPSR